MAADFIVQFIVNEKTSSRVIKLTDSSSGFTLAQGNFTVTYPDGSKRIKSDFNLSDITSPSGVVYVDALLDSNNALVVGSYKIDYVALNAAGAIFTASKSFTLDWVKPTKNILDLSDSMLPEVKFQDLTTYATSGSFTGVVTSRTFNVLMPTTSAVSGTTVTGASGLIDASVSSNYYEGVYSPKSDIVITYTHSTNSYLTVVYTDLLQTSFTIKKAPTRADLVLKINLFRAQIDAYQTTNSTQFDILNEDYDLLMSLYMHLIERAQSSTLDGSQAILNLILNILYKYVPYTYQSGPISGFYIAPAGTGTVTSVGLTAPTGFSITNSPIVGSGVIGLSFASGFSLPTDASQASWSAKQNALSGTGFVKSTAGTISYDTNTYITGNQSITLSGAVTGSGTTAITTTLANGVVGIANHSATGTASASTILRGDNTWATYYTGTVTNVSVVTANGFTGTVATSATTPAITITTSVTGVLKGNGTAISAAVAGTDYQAPLSGTGFVKSTAGTISYDTNTYLTANQSITLSGAVTGSGTTAITTTLANGVVGIANHSATGTASSTTYLRGDNTWATISGTGTVTSVAALTLGTTGTDLTSTVANGTTTPVITLNVPTASASNRGALSSTDWSTFNGKQGAITLTTTGTSGAATLVGNTLNIPQYTGGGGGSVSTVSVVSANGFAGTVATATSTPAITISTTITGLLKGNGTAISAASAGTDYQAPITLTTNNYNGAATFSANTLNIPNYGGGFTSIAASGTQVNLTVTSPLENYISGSGGQTIKLPDATTLANGTTYSFNNNQTTGAATINNNSNTLIVSVPSGGYADVILLDNSTSAGSWDRHFQSPSSVSWSTNTFDYGGSITSATWNGVAVAPNRGGTGQSTYTDGQLLIGNTTGNTLSKSTLTAGTGISITNGSGTITIAATTGGVSSFNTRTGAVTLSSTDVTTALTYTPVTNARTITINSVTYDLSADRSWTISGSGGSSIGSFSRTIQTFTATAAQTTFTISGGYTAGYIDVYVNGVRLTGADYTASNGTTVVMGVGLLVNDIVDVTIYNGIALSGTAPISFNSTTGAISISQATTSANGYLSSTDWNTFNGKQTALGYTPLNTASPTYTGILSTGTLTYTPSGLFLSAQQSANSYIQAVFQNSNAGITASADVVVNNDLSTDSTYYGNFGMNSSGFTGSGSFNLPNATYLSATSGDLVLGTTTSNAIRFVLNGGTSDIATISGTLVSINGASVIGATSIVATAQLQVDSTTKGFLPPRMTSSQRTSITTPATGLIVYQTDSVEGLYINTSTGWRTLTMV